VTERKRLQENHQLLRQIPTRMPTGERRGENYPGIVRRGGTSGRDVLGMGGGVGVCTVSSGGVMGHRIKDQATQGQYRCCDAPKPKKWREDPRERQTRG